jgi:hypothetical protein
MVGHREGRNQYVRRDILDLILRSAGLIVGLLHALGTTCSVLSDAAGF